VVAAVDHTQDYWKIKQLKPGETYRARILRKILDEERKGGLRKFYHPFPPPPQFNRDTNWKK